MISRMNIGAKILPGIQRQIYYNAAKVGSDPWGLREATVSQMANMAPFINTKTCFYAWTPDVCLPAQSARQTLQSATTDRTENHSGKYDGSCVAALGWHKTLKFIFWDFFVSFSNNLRYGFYGTWNGFFFGFFFFTNFLKMPGIKPTVRKVNKN